MSKIRIGFVGVGGMGQCAHLRNYIIIPDVQVVALAEIRPRLAEEVARRYGIPKVYKSHQELLANENLDGIVAIQAFGLHGELVPVLLEKRVPVLTEKPLADSIAAGEKIIAAVKRTGTPLYLAYQKRSELAVAYARRQMEQWQASGEVGKLRYIRAAMPPGDYTAQGYSHLIRTDEKYDAKWGMSTPYGKFVNYYIHQVNLIRFLLDEDYHVTHADAAGHLLVGRSDSGITVSLEMATHNTTIEWQEEAFIAFDRGWIKIEIPAPLAIDRPGRVTVYHDPGKDQTPTTTTPTLPFIHAMRQQAMNFVAALKGEKHPLADAETGMKDLRIAEEYIAAREESATKLQK